MKRRPNNAGCVIKLSGNRNRPYLAKKTIGIDRTVYPHKQLIKVIGYYKTYDEAAFALIEYNRKGGISRAEMTLSDVYKEWSETHFENISASTKAQYTAAYDKLEILHDIKFVNLRTGDFQRIISANKHLRKGTLSKIKVLLTMLYKYALKNDIVIKNYAEYIELPKEDKAEKEPFSDIELSILWENTDNNIVKYALILCYTGMRANEFLSLTTFNIDLDKKTIRTGSKTKAGKNRIIPIHDRIFPFISELCINSKNNKLLDINYNKLYEAFLFTMNDLGIKNKTPHSCRHTFMTMLNKQGADVKTAQKILGHTDINTTLGVYTHTDISQLQKAINLLN